jgi:hypothetical protein
MWLFKNYNVIKNNNHYNNYFWIYISWNIQLYLIQYYCVRLYSDILILLGFYNLIMSKLCAELLIELEKSINVFKHKFYNIHFFRFRSQFLLQNNKALWLYNLLYSQEHLLRIIKRKNKYNAWKHVVGKTTRIPLSKSSKAYDYVLYQYWYDKPYMRYYYNTDKNSKDHYVFPEKVTNYNTTKYRSNWIVTQNNYIKKNNWYGINIKLIKNYYNLVKTYCDLRPRVQNFMNVTGLIPAPIKFTKEYLSTLRFSDKGLFESESGLHWVDLNFSDLKWSILDKFTFKGKFIKKYILHYYNNLLNKYNKHWALAFRKIELSSFRYHIEKKKKWFRVRKRRYNYNNVIYYYNIFKSFNYFYEFLSSNFMYFDLYLYFNNRYNYSEYFKYIYDDLNISVQIPFFSLYSIRYIEPGLRDLIKLWSLNTIEYQDIQSYSSIYNFIKPTSEVVQSFRFRFLINKCLNYNLIRFGTKYMRISYFINSAFNNWFFGTKSVTGKHIKYLKRYNINRFKGRCEYYDYKVLNSFTFWFIFGLITIISKRVHFNNLVWLNIYYTISNYEIIDFQNLYFSKYFYLNNLENTNKLYELSIDAFGGRINPWWGISMKPYLLIKSFHGLSYNYLLKLF